MNVSSLDREEQALLLAAALGGDGSVPALSRVHGEAATRVRRALQELASLSSEERRRQLARLGRRLFSPIPPGLARVHPSWIAARLEAEPARIAVLLAAAMPPAMSAELGPFESASPATPDAQVSAALHGAVFGDLPWLPPESDVAGPPAALEELLGWRADRLLRLLDRLGRSGGETGAGAIQVGARIVGGGLPPSLRRSLALLLPLEIGREVLAAGRDLDPAQVLALVRRAAGACAPEEGRPT